MFMGLPPCESRGVEREAGRKCEQKLSIFAFWGERSRALGKLAGRSLKCEFVVFRNRAKLLAYGDGVTLAAMEVVLAIGECTMQLA